MRVAVLLAILAASVLYTYAAFADLAFLSVAGRLGPGFFPRLIGIALIVCCLATLVPDLRRRRSDDVASDHWVEVCLVLGLTGGLVLSLTVLGGVVATVVFLLVALSLLNPGHLPLNVAVAVLLPLGIYLLFDVWLNAAMPEGLLPLPL